MPNYRCTRSNLHANRCKSNTDISVYELLQNYRCTLRVILNMMLMMDSAASYDSFKFEY